MDFQSLIARNGLSTAADTTVTVTGLSMGGTVDLQGALPLPAVVRTVSYATTLGGMTLNDLEIDTTTTLSGDVVVGGDLTVIDGVDELDVSTSSLTVQGDAFVWGRVRMQNAAAYMLVEGSATFGSNCSSDDVGYLTQGILEVRGDFLQTDKNAAGADCADTGFKAATSHTLRLSGDTQQQVTFETPGFDYYSSQVNHLHVIGSGGVVFTTDMNIHGVLTIDTAATVTFQGTTEVLDAAATITGGASVDFQSLIARNGLSTAAGTTVSTVELSVAGSIDLQGTFPLPSPVRIVGVTSALPDLPYDALEIHADTTLGEDVSTTGDVTLVADTSRLTVGANALTVGGDLLAWGHLIMTNPSGQVVVDGDATFGASCPGSPGLFLLQSGELQLRGDFRQTDQDASGTPCQPATFLPAAGMTTRFVGDTTQTVRFEADPGTDTYENRFGTLAVSAGSDVSLETDVFVIGGANVDGQVTVNPATTWTIAGQLTASASATLDNQGAISAGSCSTDGATLLGPAPCP